MRLDVDPEVTRSAAWLRWPPRASQHPAVLLPCQALDLPPCLPLQAEPTLVVFAGIGVRLLQQIAAGVAWLHYRAVKASRWFTNVAAMVAANGQPPSCRARHACTHTESGSIYAYSRAHY